MNPPNHPNSTAEPLSAAAIEGIFYDQVDVLRTPNSPEELLAAMKSVLSLLDASIAENGLNLDTDAFREIEGYLLRLWNWNPQLTYTIRIMQELDMPGRDRGPDMIDVLPLPESLQVVAASLHQKLKSRRESLGTAGTDELTKLVRTDVEAAVE